jgi:hypothetical protein
LEKASQDVNDERQNVAVENFIEKNEKKTGNWDPDETGLYPYSTSTPLKATTNNGRPQVFYPTNNFISYYMKFFLIPTFGSRTS